MIVTLELRVAARCKACGVLTPMPGLRLRLNCRGCAAKIDFAAAAASTRTGGLRYPFGGYYDCLAEAAVLLADGSDRADARGAKGTPADRADGAGGHQRKSAPRGKATADRAGAGAANQESGDARRGEGPPAQVRKSAAAGQDCRDARDSNGTPVEVRRVAGAVCQACKASLPEPAEGAPTVTCSGCGDQVAVRWPDDETRRWDRRISWVVGDGYERGAPKRKAGSQGALLTCGNCGAPSTQLDPNDRRRLRTCTHCGAANYLHDAAWLTLFPKPEWHRCYLVYRVDERALLSLHEWMLQERGKYWLKGEQLAEVEASRARAFEAVRSAVLAAAAAGGATDAELKALATDSTLSDAEAVVIDAALEDAARARLGAKAAPTLVARWASSASAELRLVAASHPSSRPQLLDALAGDAAAQIRLVVAGRPQTPPATLARLRKDPDAKVAAAARKNPSYVPGFLENLFG